MSTFTAVKNEGSLKSGCEFNIRQIREDFPILNQSCYGKSLVFLDSAASAQKPKSVINAIKYCYEHEYANIHRGVYLLSERATQMYENTRAKVKDFINASEASEVIFTKGTTEAINLVASSYGETALSAGDEVILSRMEHHANIVPWQLIKERVGIEIKIAPIDKNGNFLLHEFEKLISSRTRIVAITHASNVLGTITPVSDIIRLAHAAGAVVLLDGAQAVVHSEVNVQKLDVDFYTFSGHKLYGPTGVGVLYAKKKWLEKLPPYIGGGAMISEVKKEKIIYAPIPEKYEAGTMPTAEVITFNESIKFVESIGMDNLIKHENEITNYALEKLKKINSVKIIGNPKNKAGVIAFTVKGVHPHDIATILDEDGVAIRAGHHCCQIFHKKMNLSATARASIGVYNTKDDIDMLCKAIENCRKIFDLK